MPTGETAKPPPVPRKIKWILAIIIIAGGSCTKYYTLYTTEYMIYYTIYYGMIYYTVL